MIRIGSAGFWVNARLGEDAKPWHMDAKPWHHECKPRHDPAAAALHFPLMHPLFDERRYLIPFRSILLPQIFTDTLVIGGGAAGLSAALAACGHGNVILLAKGALTVSNTAWAQGGIAAVLASDDSIEAHVADTIEAGAGLCDEDVVRRVISQGPASIQRLRDWGFQPDTAAEAGTGSEELALGREGGHSARRIVHAHGDATGREIARALIAQAQSRGKGSIRLFEKCFALDLITPSKEPGSPCMGAITWHPRYGLQMVWARATILACGGAGVMWRETTNPPVATGDGAAMAYRAGATMSDLAFMQFHPTTLYVAGASRTLISEAVRGEGAHLLDDSGNRFMVGVHPLAELAPRDVVSREIFRTLARTGASNVWLDCRHLTGFRRRFPGISETLENFDLDPAKDLIPVNPAAHYAVGGVRTDSAGRTDIPGVYAVGEVSCTGLHGANRLASNSLLEAVVMGTVAGEAAKEMKPGESSPWGASPRPGPVQVVSDIPISEHGEIDLSDVRSSLRSSMWRNVGIERSGGKLHDAAEMFDFWARYTLDKIFDDPSGWETQNMLLLGALTARSALRREESRGCHVRSDYPETSEALAVHDCWRRGQSEPTLTPVRRGEAGQKTRVETVSIASRAKA